MESGYLDLMNPSVDYHGEKRRRDTHESKTDKDALLFKKSKGGETRLAYLGHVLMENRQGLVVDAKLTQATGTAEREAAVDLVDVLGGTQRITLGADKNYHTQGIVEELREMTVTPHVAQNDTRPSFPDQQSVGLGTDLPGSCSLRYPASYIPAVVHLPDSQATRKGASGIFNRHMYRDPAGRRVINRYAPTVFTGRAINPG